MAYIIRDADDWCVSAEGTILGVVKLRPSGPAGAPGVPTSFEVAVVPGGSGAGSEGDALGLLQAGRAGRVVYVPLRTIQEAGNYLRKRAAERRG